MVFPRIRFQHCLSWMWDEHHLLFGFSISPFRNPKIGKGANIQIDLYKYCFLITILLDYKKHDAFMYGRRSWIRPQSRKSILNEGRRS